MNSSWVKLVIAISLDGRIAFTPSNKSNLGGKGDRKVLEEALAWSDASLMGAETLRIHKSTCLIQNQKLIKKRKAKGTKLQPTCLVVASKIDFNEKWPFFNQPINRWLITNKQNQNRELKIKGFDKKIIIQSNWSQTLDKLNENGLRKIVLLGGARLINSLLEEDKVDELQLTVVPKILGGENSWTTYKSKNLPMKMFDTTSWILMENKRLSENEIMLRYYRNRKILN